MPKRINPLDRINIDSPCSADWDEMIGKEQVRFCQHCSLYVHDLSKITRKDALKLVAASKGKLCVRYYRRPDGTVETASQAQPVSLIKRRLSRIAAGAFTATLSLASTAAAQSTTTIERSPLVAIKRASVEDKERSVNRGGRTATLVGTVFDPNQAVVPNSKVTLVNEATGQELNTTTNDEGEYQFQSVEEGTYKLKVESPGFRLYEKEKINLQGGAENRVDATLDVGVVAMGGAIVIVPETPLVKAVWDGDIDKVRGLLAEGVDIDVVDKNVDSTALAEAVGSGSLELARTLLFAGADANARNSSGRTALMRLDDDSTAEIVRALVDAGAKVNLKAEDGESAILVAAAVEKTEILQALIDAGAKVNSRNKEGKTALMIAAEQGYAENVKALLIAGADVNRKDKDDTTALKYARDNDREDVVAILIAYGATE